MSAALAPAQVRKFEATLRARYRELQQRISDELTASGSDRYLRLAGEVRDTKDESLADLLLNVSNAEIERYAAELRDIEAAVERLRKATYGRCLSCGADIGVRRLQAYPTAKRCVKCQRVVEGFRKTSSLAVREAARPRPRSARPAGRRAPRSLRPAGRS